MDIRQIIEEKRDIFKAMDLANRQNIKCTRCSNA